jgi:hypothetical protein
LLAREYENEQELAQLCRKIELGGFPLGVQHVIRILRLPKNRRGKYLRLAIEGKWSCRELAAAFQQVSGRRRAARTPAVSDRDEAVRKLQAHCEQWQRLYAAVLKSSRRRHQGDRATVELNSNLVKLLKRADHTIERLRKYLGRLRKT